VGEGIEIRRAVASDAHGIAVVHVQGWREAYAHLIAADTLAKLSVAQRELRWNEIIANPDAPIWVAVDDERVIGWAGAATSRAENPPRRLELEGLYILASHYGSGAGQRLLEAAIGDEPAFLWVASDNPRARAFYARNGFVSDGVTDLHSLAGTPVEATRMVRWMSG
jgi:GNAT superfamily N-acetyltransferase